MVVRLADEPLCSDGLANAPTSRCPSGSIVSAGHWYSRSTRVATGFADRKNRRRCWSPRKATMIRKFLAPVPGQGHVVATMLLNGASLTGFSRQHEGQRAKSANVRSGAHWGLKSDIALCLKRVKLGSQATQSRLPLFPQQQTFLRPVVTSEKCHKRDSCTAANSKPCAITSSAGASTRRL